MMTENDRFYICVLIVYGELRDDKHSTPHTNRFHSLTTRERLDSQNSKSCAVKCNFRANKYGGYLVASLVSLVSYLFQPLQLQFQSCSSPCHFDSGMFYRKILVLLTSWSSIHEVHLILCLAFIIIVMDMFEQPVKSVIICHHVWALPHLQNRLRF